MGSSLLVSLCLAASLGAGPAVNASRSSRSNAIFSSLFDDSAPLKQSAWQVSWERPEAASEPPVLDPSLAGRPRDDGQQARPRVVAVEYSDAYRVRARIHKLASVAMLPLFGTELYLGQSVYNGSTGGKRSAHIAVGAAIGTLFGVNTVTGAWNLWDGRKDTNHRTRRFAHGILMLAADAGFLATAMLAPSREDDFRDFSNFNDRRSTHRAVAFTSIGLGTAGYLVMLLGGR